MRQTIMRSLGYMGRQSRMRRLGTKTRRPPRGMVQITAVAVVLAGTGMAVTGASPAAGQQVVMPQLNYACTYPSGLRGSNLLVGVQVKASFPQAGAVGQPIQPTNAELSITVPQAEVANLAKLHAATVAAADQLNVKVAENGASASDPWSGTTPGANPLPASGSLVLRTAGAVPSATVRTAGDVTFTADKLTVLLTPRSATGAATNPPLIPLSCQVRPGQNATLAIVPITAAVSSSDPRSPGSSATRAPITVRQGGKQVNSGCPPYPKGGFNFNRRFKLPGYPHGSTVTFPPALQACANVIGFSDIRKLNGAALVGPGLSNLSVGKRVVVNQKANYFQIDSAGELYYKPCATCQAQNAMPPATNTLLSFSFVPTTVTLQVIELGTLNIASVGGNGVLLYSRVWSQVKIHVISVKVNGVPLNVGNSCGTGPFDLVLTGKPPYTLQTGGMLNGTVTIPPFTGCGAQENLDPIFTTSVSGPGNYVQLTQGSLCTPLPVPTGCPPTVPIPIH